VLAPSFLSSVNILNLLRQISITGVVACGLTFVILSGEIDLSVGSVSALAGVTAAYLQVNQGFDTLPAASIALVLSLVVGLCIGFIVTRARVHSFIVTLGFLSIARGFALIISQGYPISGLNSSFRFLGAGRIGFMPLPVVIFFLIAGFVYFVLRNTAFGKHVYAIGGNEEAARLSGVNVEFCKVVVFGISGLLAGLSGLILAGRVNSGQPVASEGLELDAIAAVVIGGTSLSGGVGGVGGTIVGALLLGVIRNGLNLIGVSPFWQKVVMGFLIVIAVIVDKFRGSRVEK